MTKPDTRRALFRQHMYIPPWDKVRPAFIILDFDDVHPVFECCTCEGLMQWDDAKQYWECPECEYELTPGEARDLHESIRKTLDKLYGKRRSWLWDLLTWWRRRRADRSKRLPQQT